MEPLPTTHADEMRVPTHCVFRRASSWLALPAVIVREVIPRVEPVFVPGMPDAFAGLCHVRSEFVPVVNLSTVLPETEMARNEIMLVLDDMDGPWAVFVDEVTSLRALEVSDAPETDATETASVVIGWATDGDTVIQVLDQSRIRQFAEGQLAAFWHSSRLEGAFADTSNELSEVTS